MSRNINGFALQVPHGATPLTDLTRRKIFDRIGAMRFKEARVLDLFAGSGTNGLEALYRGAKTAVFVDYSIDAEAALRQNLATCRMVNRGTIVLSPVEEFLGKNYTKFDVIFVDHPQSGQPLKQLRLITGAIKKGGLVVYIHKKVSQPPPFSPFKLMATEDGVTSKVHFLNLV